MTIRIILFSLLICFSCLSDKKQGFEKEMNHYVKRVLHNDCPGGVVLIKKKGEIIFSKAYGLANMDTKEMNTLNTLFNLGFLSRTFIANSILVLEQEGKLSLEDPINSFFHDFDQKSIAQKIKIKHLLTHTSGLPNNRNVKMKKEFYYGLGYKERFETMKHNDFLYFEPGERFMYSEPAYNGLALIIEKLEGEKWQRVIKEKILKPSGMDNTILAGDEFYGKKLACGYKKRNSHVNNNQYVKIESFNHSQSIGVWSSVLDLAKYEEAIQNCTFMSSEAVKKSRKVFYPSNWVDFEEPFMGMAWMVNEPGIFFKSKNQNFDFISYTSSLGGFTSFYYVIPEKDILYIGLFNKYLTNEEFSGIIAKGFLLMEKYNWFE